MLSILKLSLCKYKHIIFTILYYSVLIWFLISDSRVPDKFTVVMICLVPILIITTPLVFITLMFKFKKDLLASLVNVLGMISIASTFYLALY